MIRFFLIIAFAAPFTAYGQTGIKGRVIAGDMGAIAATVSLNRETRMTDSAGVFHFDSVQAGKYRLKVSFTGFNDHSSLVTTDGDSIIIKLLAKIPDLDEVVVTGTLKEVKRMESPVPVEVYSAAFFKKNPAPSIFDALQNVNGVRPQLNCNVCNTGDIHINGLEGPYTMVLIDGMPIVSSLSTVYGLSGIPASLVDRIEIVKGPASSLYGSEAVGGLVNIITKNPVKAPAFSLDIMQTSWNELNADAGLRIRAGKLTGLLGINAFHFGNIKDLNNDGFTDVTLQKRISVFQKLTLERSRQRVANLAARYFYEDRWGGDTRWNKTFRGGDSIYGESIYTGRWEVIGNYQLPFNEKLMLAFSYNDHQQNSRYGTTSYIASQQVGFAQVTWNKSLGNHDLLKGIAARLTRYDDNTIGTVDPEESWLPGIFLQDEWAINPKHKLLVGFRYDNNSIHGAITTPRIAYKWMPDEDNILRLNAGTGFRVVNLFTEDHAALTGARKVVVSEKLEPEKSSNINLNYLKKIRAWGSLVSVDLSLWYTHFTNRIIADLESNPSEIRYNNLSGYAVSKGLSMNFDLLTPGGFKLIAGGTLQDVSTVSGKLKQQQLLTEHFTATWQASYKIRKLKLGLDLTGNIYSPMRLPLLGPNDPRPLYSPWWGNQNIQFTYSRGIVEIYGGIKNLLNWTPPNDPFIIARSHDPFDKLVEFDASGNVIPTLENPYGLTFDPNYLYAPNQGIRGFLGLRVTLQSKK